MPIPSANPVAQAIQSSATHTLQQNQAGAQPWKLNQLLTAQVIRMTSGETALRINGQVYSPVTPLSLAPGTSRQLRVASLDPVIQLTLINNDKARDIPVRLVNPAAHGMTESLWASSLSTGPYKLATLLSLLQNPPRIVQQHLSSQAQGAFSGLSALLPQTNDFKKGSQIRNILASLALGGTKQGQFQTPDSASPLAKILQNLQQQLLIQVQNNKTQVQQHQAIASYRTDQAMRASVATALLNLLEEATMSRSHRQLKQYAPDQHFCQWHWQFPMLEGSRGRLFSLRARVHRRPHKSSSRGDSYCRLRCAFELAGCGKLAIVIHLHNREVRIHLLCEESATTRRLLHGKSILKEGLAQMDLRLRRFSCAHQPVEAPVRQSRAQHKAPGGAEFEEHGSLTESLNERMRHAAVCGELPMLEDFEIQQQRQKPDELMEMPDSAHQVLACLFCYLLDS